MPVLFNIHISVMCNISLSIKSHVNIGCGQRKVMICILILLIQDLEAKQDLQEIVVELVYQGRLGLQAQQVLQVPLVPEAPGVSQVKLVEQDLLDQ